MSGLSVAPNSLLSKTRIEVAPPLHGNAQATPSHPTSKPSDNEIPSRQGSANNSVASQVQAQDTALDTPLPIETAPSLGYKDELSQRFVFGRELGTGRHGTVVRSVVDRNTGKEYACKCLPKTPLLLSPKTVTPPMTPDELEQLRARQLESIKAEIHLFSELKCSLNVCQLEEVYEDNEHVYMVTELCTGKTLAEVSTERDHSESEVASYIRSIVKTLAVCHEKGIAHGSVDMGRFMFLNDRRDSQLKATSFGRINDSRPNAEYSLFDKLSQQAPTMLNKQPRLGKQVDMWATGLVSARLLTGYFPFDDILENFISNSGMLEHISPISSYLNDNPWMPSGAALFVSSMIMVMDFSRPHWKPVSVKAKDFIVQALKWEPKERLSALDALKHPWLARFTQPGLATPADEANSLHKGVVQKIQRFGGFSHLKRAALEHITHELMSQHNHLSEALNSLDGEEAAARTKTSAPSVAGLSPAHRQTSSNDINKTATFKASSDAPSGADKEAPTSAETLSAQEVHQLMAQLNIRNGVVDRDALEDGLVKLGYKLEGHNLDHLLGQLSAVPGIQGGSQITSDVLAASQMDWQSVQEDGKAWTNMARAAFDVLDSDKDGFLQRSEITDILVGRIPVEDMEQAMQEAMEDSGQNPNAQKLDFDAFMHLLQIEDSTTATESLARFPSLIVRSGPLRRGISRTLTSVLRSACSIRMASPSHVSGPLRSDLSRCENVVQEGESDEEAEVSVLDGRKRRGSALPSFEDAAAAAVQAVKSPFENMKMPSFGMETASGGAGGSGGGKNVLLGGGYADDEEWERKRDMKAAAVGGVHGWELGYS